MSLEDYPPLPSDTDTEEQVKRFVQWQQVMMAKIAILSAQYESQGMDAKQAYLLANYATWPQEYWSILCPPPSPEKDKLRQVRIRCIVQELRQEGNLTIEAIEERFLQIPRENS